uniref:Predicted protein n=1 Tax=Physcomitrium patens TaxID=3218 RepID=A9TUX7_PHYPA
MLHLQNGAYSKGPYQPVWNAFSDGAYYIPEIGGIDLFVAASVLNLPSPVVIVSFVPATVAAVKTAITTLHDSGGRLYFIVNTPPQGCNPAQLTQFPNRAKDALLCVDDINACCKAALNAINRAYRAALQQALEDLRTRSVAMARRSSSWITIMPALRSSPTRRTMGLPTLCRRVVAPEDPTTTTRPSRAATSGRAARGSRRARRPEATFPGMGFVTLTHSTDRLPSSSSMGSLSLQL